MRFTKNIDIPDELIRAQEEDKLVIFAGAGVCMSPPTNLPGFKELIKEVENKYGMERKDREEYDKYLGRVKRDGKPVEDFIRTRFSGSALLHNQLHVGVISLFRQDGPTRIITTNFDVLFSNALDSLHREKVHHYHAPALPPGNRFEGIVHLHGCAAETISELVFTDDDFGRAYLREGWAREFLTGVFSQFKVLFIGYSIEDPFVRYFVRGLTPESRIYAFVHRGKVPDWRDLGAMPISGDILQKSDFYEEQQESIVEWGQHCNMSISEHERKIKQLTSLLLPHDRVNSDYIIACLKDLARTRLFARYVTDKDWLAWLDKKQVLDNLFANRSELSAIDSVLAEWISKEFVRQHTAEVIDVILDHNMSLNPDFWRIIVENLSRDEDKLEPKELAKWVQVLLRDPPDLQTISPPLEFLLSKCRFPADKHTATLLFEYLAFPVAASQRNYLANIEEPGTSSNIDFQIAIRGEDYWLEKAWKEYFKPNLHSFQYSLTWVIQHHLSQAYEINRSIGLAGENFDRESWHRSSIAPHDQDRHARPIDLLIDIARDVLEHTLEVAPAGGAKLRQVWFDSGVPLLRRIALHGLAFDNASQADAKLRFILDENLMFERTCKHEVFQVISAAFGGADQGIQAKFIDRVKGGPDLQPDSPDKKVSFNYQIFNLLGWISLGAPNSGIAKEAFKECQAEHPEFKQRKHPDLDYVIGDVKLLDERTPYPVEYFLNTDMKEAFIVIIDYKGEKEFGISDRDDMLSELSKAVNSWYLYGFHLTSMLLEKKEWKEDVWSAIIGGWTDSQFVDFQWEHVLGILEMVVKPTSAINVISRFLESGVKRTEYGIPLSMLGQAEKIADDCWAIIAVSEDRFSEGFDCFNEALNDPAGVLTEFWLQALSRHREAAGDNWKGLPEDYRARLAGIVESSKYRAGLSRVMLASRIHFLYYLDQTWTENTILPLLDYAQDSERAEQVWQGFLYWGRIPPPLSKRFHALLLSAAKHFSGKVGGLREKLLEHITQQAFISPTRPGVGSWFYDIIKIISPDEPAKIVGNLCSSLRGAKDSAKENIWTRFLKGFWNDRVENIPNKLKTKEADAFISCVPHLGPVFSEAVDLACKTREIKLYQTFFYTELNKSGLAEKYPKDVYRLLMYILPSSAEERFLHCGFVNPIFTVLKTHLSDEELKPLREKLLQLGCR